MLLVIGCSDTIYSDCSRYNYNKGGLYRYCFSPRIVPPGPPKGWLRIRSESRPKLSRRGASFPGVGKDRKFGQYPYWDMGLGIPQTGFRGPLINRSMLPFLVGTLPMSLYGPSPNLPEHWTKMSHIYPISREHCRYFQGSYTVSFLCIHCHLYLLNRIANNNNHRLLESPLPFAQLIVYGFEGVDNSESARIRYVGRFISIRSRDDPTTNLLYCGDQHSQRRRIHRDLRQLDLPVLIIRGRLVSAWG